MDKKKNQFLLQKRTWTISEGYDDMTAESKKMLRDPSINEWKGNKTKIRRFSNRYIWFWNTNCLFKIYHNYSRKPNWVKNSFVILLLILLLTTINSCNLP